LEDKDTRDLRAIGTWDVEEDLKVPTRCPLARQPYPKYGPHASKASLYGLLGQ